ncbi:MAG: hypothetical protein WCC38_12835, partial [Pseudonocardiaceae bacterium]
GWALGVRLARFFLVRGYYEDWHHVCDLMVSGARRSVNGGREGAALRASGGLRRLQVRLDEALEAFEQTLKVCGAAGATGRIGAPDEALPHLEHALGHLRELADRHSDASAMRELGAVHRLQRCHEKAARCVQQVLDALDVFSDPPLSVALMPTGSARASRLAALQDIPHAGW